MSSASAPGGNSRGQKSSKYHQSPCTGRTLPLFFSLRHVVGVSDRGRPLRRPQLHSRRLLPQRPAFPGKKKRAAASDGSISHGCGAGGPGQRCHGRLSMAQRQALSLFLEVCVRVYSGFGDLYKGAIGDGARTSRDMLAKQTAGAAQAQESSTICPPLGC